MVGLGMSVGSVLGGAVGEADSVGRGVSSGVGVADGTALVVASGVGGSKVNVGRGVPGTTSVVGSTLGGASTDAPGVGDVMAVAGTYGEGS